MARRAGLFKHYRDSGKSFLVISGPYEFLIDDPFRYGIHAPESVKTDAPPAADAALALDVHNLLHVNLGWLSSKAEKWLRERAGGVPAGYAPVGAEPVSRIIDTQAGKIGVVLFPEGRQPGKGPDAALAAKALAAGKALQGKTRLVIGVSPWGYVGERDFLKKAEGVFGCILGGGEGIGFDFSLREAPGVLWLRPDTQGRAVNILELLELPAFGESPRWKQDDSFRAYLEFLGDPFPYDPVMKKRIGDPPD